MFSKFLKLLLLLVVAGAAKQVSAQPGPGETKNPAPVPVVAVAPLDLGQLDGTNYVNNFFGLSLSVPREWVVQSAQQRGKIVDDSKKMVGSVDEKKKAQVEDSIDRSTILLSLTKLPEGMPGNAAFMLIAERIPSASMKTGADVLRSIALLGKGTNFGVEFLDEIRTVQIGTAEFAGVTIKGTSPYGEFKQKAYVTTKNGYAVQLFFTYLDDADIPTFATIMKSVMVK